MPACTRCDDCGWVCEAHPDRPWEGPRACGCGGGGDPCPACNSTDKENAPRLPKGMRVDADKAKGWRH